MSKFKAIKRLDLSFVGEDWKECYINYNALTSKDMDEFVTLGNTQADDPKLVEQRISKIRSILKNHFISGKAVGEDGSLVDITLEDFDNDLPLEILDQSVSFLSLAAQRKG